MLSHLKMYDFGGLGSVYVGSLLRSDSMSSHCLCGCLWILRVPLIDACLWRLVSFSNLKLCEMTSYCCDVYVVIYHFDFIRKEVWACLVKSGEVLLKVN